MTRPDAQAAPDAIDSVARAMTSGAPRADFADRVMAPIYGRPRRDFVARVMAGLDAPQARVARRGRVGIYGPAFAAATVGLAILAMVWPTNGPLPGAPPAPISIAALGHPRIAFRPIRPVPTGAPHRIVPHWRGDARDMNIPVAIPPSEIYTIDALEGPSRIDIDTIDPAPMTVRPLAAPAPLAIPSLRIFKESL